MQLAVFAIVIETLREVVRFMKRHPIPLLIAMTCSVPIQYRLMVIDLANQEQGGLSAFAASAVLLAAELMVWLPLVLLAIRETVTGEAARFHLGGLPSMPTSRYAAYSLVLLLLWHVVVSGGSSSAALIAARTVLGVAAIWFVLRATLTFTALALGRLDLGLSHSIAKTSGLTWRLLPIFVAPPVAILTVAFIVALALILLADEFDGDARAFSTVLFGVVGQIAQLTVAIAGALIYRAIEGRSGHTGQY